MDKNISETCTQRKYNVILDYCVFYNFTCKKTHLYGRLFSAIKFYVTENWSSCSETLRTPLWHGSRRHTAPVGGVFTSVEDETVC